MHSTKRYSEIISVMMQEDFAHLLYETKLVHKFTWFDQLRTKLSKPKDPPQVRLRRMIERLGPSFIKFGQLLSTRPDLLPPEYISELEKLQDNVPQEEWSVVKPFIEEQLGCSIKKAFKEFDHKPVASASIAQVYRAKLKNNRVVAVKVKRPSVEHIIREDLEILEEICALVDKKFDAVKKYKLPKIVKEMRSWTLNELDFTKEQEHIELFASINQSDLIVVPKVYSKYTTESLLVMEYIDGIHLNDIQAIKKKRLPLRALLRASYTETLRQIFEHGFFHADPHPGNFIITKDHKIAFLDFGIVGNFDDWLRNYTARLVLAALNQDADALTQLLLDISIQEGDTDVDVIKKHVKKSLRELDRSLENIHMGVLFNQAISAATEAKLQVPVEFVLFAKTIIASEGVARTYDPTFNMTKESEPFIRDFVKQNMMDEFSKENIALRMFTLGKNVLDLPGVLSRLLQKFEDGNIKLHIKDTDIHTLSTKVDLASQRISYAAIATACIISGSLTHNITFSMFGVVFPLALIFYVLAIYITWQVVRTHVEK